MNAQESSMNRIEEEDEKLASELGRSKLTSMVVTSASHFWPVLSMISHSFIQLQMRWLYAVPESCGRQQRGHDWGLQSHRVEEYYYYL